MKYKSGYTIILPTLNESGHIKKLIENIELIFSETKNEYEIIVVDDSSSDETADIVKDIEKNNINTKLYQRKNLKRNLADSINLGIQNSQYENIIWMDADFQHPPKYIKMFQNYVDKYDLIVFSRFLRDSIRYFKNDQKKKENNENQSFFFNKLCKFFLYKDITDFTSGFVCVKRKIFDDYKLKGYYGEYFIDLIIYCKLKKYSIIELPFSDEKRFSGLSKTYPGFSLKYLILSLNYLLCLAKNLLRKILKY